MWEYLVLEDNAGNRENLIRDLQPIYESTFTLLIVIETDFPYSSYPELAWFTTD